MYGRVMEWLKARVAAVEAASLDLTLFQSADEAPPCAGTKLGWREFYFAIASLLLILGILATHGGIVLLFLFPCMGLMERENEEVERRKAAQRHRRLVHASPRDIEMRVRVCVQECLCARERE